MAENGGAAADRTAAPLIKRKEEHPMKRTLTPQQKLEQGLLTDFRKPIWRPFVKAIRQYELIQPGDKIAVCISGGKDSMLLAKLMQLLHRHTEVPFELVYLIMDPGYSAKTRALVESNARTLGIPYVLFESDVFAASAEAAGQDKNPCFLCARMRRGCLYGKAKELGCTKIALGHHVNDVIETTVMAMLYGGQLQGMLPRLKARNFPGMELIRPLYMVHEEDILAWQAANELHFIQCACRFTEAAARDAHASKRQEVKRLLRTLRQENPSVELNVFGALHALDLDTIPAWKSAGQAHSFLERFREEEKKDQKMENQA